MGRELIVEADGGSRGNPGPAGFGALVRDAQSGAILAERATFLGITSNNVAEYSGLVAGLRAAAQIDPTARVLVRMDSKLVVEQMAGRWKIKHEDMRRLAAEATTVIPPSQVTYEWVPRAQNSAADRLANEAMDTGGEIVRDYPPDADPMGKVADVGSVAGHGQGEGAEAPVGDGASGHDGVTEKPAHPSGARVRFDDAQPLTVVLVRHGETPFTIAGLHSGSSVPGPPLTAKGRTQAARAADLVYRVGRELWTDLPRPSAILASPMVRAQETARAVSRRLGLPVRTDDRYAEVNFGDWEGLTAAEVGAGWPGQPQHWLTDGTVRAPEGESIADVGARVWAGLQELVAEGVGRTVVVVGHAVQVRAAVGRAVESPPSRWSGFRIPPGSVSILRLWADGATELTVVGCPSEG